MEMVVGKYKAFMSNIRNHPLESIEVLVAFCMLFMGIYTIIPSEWLHVTSAYPTYASKITGGVVMITPSIILVIHRTKGIINYLGRPSMRKNVLFLLSIMYVYIAVLRMATLAFFPPIFILYLVLGLISAVLYLRLVVRGE